MDLWPIRIVNKHYTNKEFGGQIFVYEIVNTSWRKRENAKARTQESALFSTNHFFWLLSLGWSAFHNSEILVSNTNDCTRFISQKWSTFKQFLACTNFPSRCTNTSFRFRFFLFWRECHRTKGLEQYYSPRVKGNNAIMRAFLIAEESIFWNFTLTPV